MKKIVGIVLFMLVSYTSVYAFEKNELDQIGLNLVGENYKKKDPELIGEWYLRKTNYSKYKRVINDEFELGDAINSAFKLFENNISPNSSYLEKEFIIKTRTKFGKYNFSNEAFPIDTIIENSYFTYYGDQIVYESKLFFDNASASKNILKMKKNEAKAFIKSRKNRYGDVNRNLNLKITYKIVDISSNDSVKNSRSNLNIKFMGHIQKFEFSKKNGELIKTINF